MTRPTHAALRVGVIGYGLGGSAFHAPFIAATPGLELTAIVTRDADPECRMGRSHHVSGA